MDGFQGEMREHWGAMSIVINLMFHDIVWYMESELFELFNLNMWLTVC